MTSPTDAPALTQKRTSYLELFFDLVFVFAITQLADLLHADHTASGWVRAALMAWLVWWAWSQYTWAGNAIDLDRRPVRLAVLAVSGVALLAAVAIPDAYTGDGLWFAVPYTAVRLAGLALYWGGLRRDPAHRAALRTYLPVAAVSPLLVLLGGALAESVRPWIWAGAVAVDVASVLAAGRGEFRVAPAHFAERHALIVIIALGESIIAVGASAAQLEPTVGLVVVGVLGFAIAAALWWDYFDRLHAVAEARLADEPDHRRRGHLARDLFTLGHLPLVVGTVLFAVGVEEAVVAPGEPLEGFGRVAIAAGLSLFLVGFVAAGARATGNLLAERLVTAALSVAIVAALGDHVGAAALLGLLAAVVVAAATIETVRLSDRPPLPAPPGLQDPGPQPVKE